MSCQYLIVCLGGQLSQEGHVGAAMLLDVAREKLVAAQRMRGQVQTRLPELPLDSWPGHAGCGGAG